MDNFKRKTMTVRELLEDLINGTISPGPICHSDLPDDLLKEMRRLWHSVGKAFYGTRGTLEQWEIGFVRDTNPDKEVLVWQRIERATKGYLADHPKASLDETVTGICLCSFGASQTEYNVYWDRAAIGIVEDGQHQEGYPI